MNEFFTPGAVASSYHAAFFELAFWTKAKIPDTEGSAPSIFLAYVMAKDLAYCPEKQQGRWVEVAGDTRDAFLREVIWEVAKWAMLEVGGGFDVKGADNCWCVVGNLSTVV